MRVLRADAALRDLDAPTATATVELTQYELVIVNNALNEILDGPEAIDHEGEFHSRIGSTRAEARALLDELHALLQ